MRRLTARRKRPVVTRQSPKPVPCQKNLKTFALTIYGEARGEGYEGMIAVASVIMNRSRISGMSVHAVCRRPWQFSCWNKKDPNYPILTDMEKSYERVLEKNIHLRICHWIAEGFLGNWLASNVGQATHYHAKWAIPNWDMTKINLVGRIGNHLFYFEPGWRR